MLRLAFIFGLALCATAADWTRLQPEGYVSDFAHVIDAESRAAIERYLESLEKASGAQIAIVTIKNLDGEPVDDVANTIYRHFGVGKKGSNEGALFLLSIDERKSRLEVGYGLEPIVPDGVAGDILRAMRPALRAGQYGPGLIEAARVLGTKIAAGKNITIPEVLPQRRAFREERRDDISVKQIGLIVGVIIVFAWLNRGRRRGGGYYVGTPWTHHGGGFGGSSSSGSSWGGFGGGDSGGGGASSDW